MKRAAIPLSLFLGIYVLSYFVLSLFGAYASATWGLSKHGMAPKSYKWLPRGFYISATGEWRRAPLFFYAPLFIADNYFWHTHGGYFLRDGDPQYPVVVPNFTRK